MERARAGSSYGWEDDLPLLLAYKRVQSVYTDVIRTALLLGAERGRGRGRSRPWSKPGSEPGSGSGSGSGLNLRLLPRAAWRIQRVLAAAALEPSGADRELSRAAVAVGAAEVPSYRQVVAAYRNWFRTARPPEPLTPSAP
ncbi:hypothetical protein ACFXKS_32070 [Streptomyces scopuliridis]|uniref:hypothetical protein n=1 Tax=Streptomyces scopuliridis TaxID=452529 RepID=UPI0036847775